MNSVRILIAGIGNIFLGDDAFGVEVAQRLANRTLPEGVRVVDFGIRGYDLAYALLDGYDAAILLDASPRGGAPGTLYVIDPELDEWADPEAGEGLADAHAMNVTEVFRFVKAMGGRLPPVRLVACEPGTLGAEGDGQMGLSPPVSAAVEPAIELVNSLVEEIQNDIRISSLTDARVGNHSEHS